MNGPSKLYRFRWLSTTTIRRELSALEQSYLYAAPFSAMNDPMEAFYETGGPGDHIVDSMLSPAGKSAADFYKLLDDTIAGLALLSFTGTYEALPLWAYYANNFAGMCLEFDTRNLKIGDLQGEELRPVIYARQAAPSIGLQDFGSSELKEAVISRICRKRTEWAHEKEWRFVTGTVGPKHYLDDALSRVYLGPKIQQDHAQLVCEALRRRPVEVMQGVVRGFELEFQSMQSATPYRDCERVGAGKFNPSEDLYAEPELRNFFGVLYRKFVEECWTTALRPNFEQFAGIDISTQRKNAAYIQLEFKLRNGRNVYCKRYFDRYMRVVEDTD